jgi:signal transduction histidine kinase
MRERFRTGISESCAGGREASAACLSLAEEMALAESRADPLVAYWGSSLLARLEATGQWTEQTSLLRRRLERILFEDTVRRHHGQLLPVLRPGKKSADRWLQIGRYRLSGLRAPAEDGTRIVGFDSQPRPEDVRDFLIARNVVEGGGYRFRVHAHPEPARREASVAFVDEKAGFLSVEDPDFAGSLARSRRGTELMIVWFSLAGAVLLASLWLAYRSSRVAMENVRLRENFVASISHEFRSPLGGLDLMIETLLSGKLDETARRREYLEQMLEETRRLSRLSENMLTMGRLQRTRESRRDTWLPGEVLTAVIAQVRPQAEAKGIEVAPACESGLPGSLGDPDLIQMALLNLVENAVKFSPPGGRVDVCASRQDGDIRFSVQDQGPGVPPGERERIFEWFYRPGDELSRETRGTGLGLAIVREVAERHRGRIQVQSRPGEGARFDMLIPVDEAPNREAGHDR